MNTSWGHVKSQKWKKNLKHTRINLELFHNSVHVSDRERQLKSNFKRYVFFCRPHFTGSHSSEIRNPNSRVPMTCQLILYRWLSNYESMQSRIMQSLIWSNLWCLLHMTKSMCIAVQLRKFFFHSSQLHNKPLLEKSQNPREIRTCSLPIARHKC